MRRKNIDMILLDLHVGILLGYFRSPRVPIGHRNEYSVRLRRIGELAFSLHRCLETVAKNPLDSCPSEDGLLDHSLLFRPAVDEFAVVGILTLGVFSHDQEVDLAGFDVGQGRSHARHQSDRPKVHILIELPTDRQQQTPQRNVIGYARKTDRSKENRVVPGELLDAVGRHHLACLRIVLARPGKSDPVQREAKQFGRAIKHTDAFGEHLLADPVAWDACYCVVLGRCQRSLLPNQGYYRRPGFVHYKQSPARRRICLYR